MKIPELLAPAGGMRQLRAAVRFGADAVYVGMKQYGLRAFAGNFDDEELAQAVRIAHGAGRRLYVTMNIFAYDEDVPGMLEAARRARQTGADALIVTDLGVIELLRRELPDMPLHVSTQANTLNSLTAALYHRMGAQRVIPRAILAYDRAAVAHLDVAVSPAVPDQVSGAAGNGHKLEIALRRVLGAGAGPDDAVIHTAFAVIKKVVPYHAKTSSFCSRSSCSTRDTARARLMTSCPGAPYTLTVITTPDGAAGV